MTNPNKYIRKAYLSLLSGLTIGSVPVPLYDKRVPKSVDPVPPLRVIINSQSKQQANTSKGGHDWSTMIELDIIAEFSIGNANTAVTDDIEEQISDMIDIAGDIDCPPFTVWNTTIDQPNDLVMDTKTTTIVRKIVRYNHVMGL